MEKVSLAPQNNDSTIVEGPGVHSVQFHWGLAGLDYLAGNLKSLEKTLPKQRLLHFIAWYRALLTSLEKKPEDIVFCVVSKEEDAKAIIPLKKINRWCLGMKLRCLQLPNHPCMPFGDYLVTIDETADNFAKSFFEQLTHTKEFTWDYLEFPHVPAGSKATFAFVSLSGYRATTDQIDHVDFIPVSTYEDYKKKLSKKFRSNLNRARKNLQKEGGLEYCTYSSVEELKSVYPEFLELESSGWKGEQGTAVKLTDYRTFFQNLIHSFGEMRRCEIHMLRLNGKGIAGQFLLRNEDSLFRLKIAYDEYYAKFAPGNVLFEETLQRCDQRPEISFFNLVSGAAWHGKWKPEQYPTYELRLFRRTFRGWISYHQKRWQRGITKFAYKHIRPIYRRIRGKPLVEK